jgi:hypothetical protein
MGASAGATANAGDGGGTDATSYFVDALFRPSDPARLAAPGAEGDALAAAKPRAYLLRARPPARFRLTTKLTLANLLRHEQAFPRPMRLHGSMRS